jgi:hypothetical protein
MSQPLRVLLLMLAFLAGTPSVAVGEIAPSESFRGASHDRRQPGPTHGASEAWAGPAGCGEPIVTVRHGDSCPWGDLNPGLAA